MRFDNNTPSSNVTVSDIKIRSKAVYAYAKDNVWRQTFTYTAGSAYGAHYSGGSMFRIGQWYARGMLEVSNY